MQKYTISVCYHLPYMQDVVVEAKSIEEACDLAIEQANDDPNWRAVDEPMASYVDGIYVGETETGRYWDKPENAPDDPEIPAGYSELITMYSRETLCMALFGKPLSKVSQILGEAADSLLLDGPCVTDSMALQELWEAIDGETNDDDDNMPHGC